MTADTVLLSLSDLRARAGGAFVSLSSVECVLRLYVNHEDFGPAGGTDEALLLVHQEVQRVLVVLGDTIDVIERGVRPEALDNVPALRALEPRDHRRRR